ncbi:hypothetical protein [Nocardia sp. NPDC004604]|uniref:hypothetical protein n=1 Tax=Nocardia sp. NPDC004604 TaxID=3157013 RepID=UPI0033A617B8
MKEAAGGGPPQQLGCEVGVARGVDLCGDVDQFEYPTFGVVSAECDDFLYVGEPRSFDWSQCAEVCSIDQVLGFAARAGFDGEFGGVQ